MGSRCERRFALRMTGWCAAGVLLLGVIRATAGPNPYQALLDNSPFLTPAFKARLGQRDTSALSFVGFTRVGESWLFAIVDRKADSGYWLCLNEEQNGIKIESFDEQKETISLTVGGIGVDLTLDRDK